MDRRVSLSVLIAECITLKKLRNNFISYWRGRMGWFTRMFGTEGVVRFEGVCYDGQTFSGKCSIETIGMGKEEVEEKLKGMVFVEKGIQVKTLRVTGFYET
jgi:hypothetical protein